VRLRSRRIVCPNGTVTGEVVIERGRIAAVEAIADNQGARDLGDDWLVPGFIDSHVHGGGGAQTNTSDPDEVAEVARFHSRHGTTSLITTTMAAPPRELETTLDAIARCTAPTLLGAHLEGPFLNPKWPGAMDPSLFVEPDQDLLERLLAAGAGRVRVMTLAPELPGALELIERLVRAGVVASVGHTDASERQIADAVRAGATSATHVFNAMAPFHHRAPGAVGAVLDLPELSCELICDGLHVDPAAARLVYRTKGLSGMRLVTDAMAAAGMPDGEYRLGARPVIVTDGQPVTKDGLSIAGSTLTMELAVQNAVHFLGISLPEAVVMASTNSARLLGLADRKGAIAAGFDADLVVLDERLAVRATMVGGRWVHSQDGSASASSGSGSSTPRL
jgi:N-acetylglucosamine-6-phosphate deacetylase